MTKSIIALALITTAAIAAEESQPPQTITVPKQAQLVGNVVVPVPSEIFNVLDKLGKPNWTAVLRAPKGTVAPFGNQQQIALNLGTIIAEGFIAVEAGNTAAVKDIGKSVLSLSKALGVSKEVTSRANAIIAAADKQEWNQVRKELDGALSEVRGAMGSLGSPELADLVSLAGWVRGTEALCEVVDKNYSKDGADLLRQDMLLDFFDGKLRAMAGKKPATPLVPKLQEGLKTIRQLIGPSDSSEISAKSVKEVGETASGLVKSIQTK
jgi:hypothetical protein